MRESRYERLERARAIRAVYRLAATECLYARPLPACGADFPAWLEESRTEANRLLSDAEDKARREMGPQLAALLDEAEQSAPFTPGWYGQRPRFHWLRSLARWFRAAPTVSGT